ncbi:MAG: hypothetical protein B6I28_03945, partial [Fusobacteriia bacterium 4572_132]
MDEKYKEKILKIEKENKRSICAYPTKTGTPCKNEIKNGEMFCYLHKNGNKKKQEEILEIKKELAITKDDEKEEKILEEFDLEEAITLEEEVENGEETLTEEVDLEEAKTLEEE